MSIRLNKVTKECNVGLQTVVEVLQKKGFEGIEANPNTKISEAVRDIAQGIQSGQRIALRGNPAYPPASGTDQGQAGIIALETG